MTRTAQARESWREVEVYGLAQARRERGMRSAMKGWKMERWRMRRRVSRVRWWDQWGSGIVRSGVLWACLDEEGDVGCSVEGPVLEAGALCFIRPERTFLNLSGDFQCCPHPDSSSSLTTSGFWPFFCTLIGFFEH